MDATETRIREAWERADYRRGLEILIGEYGPGIRRYLAALLRSGSRGDEAWSMFGLDMVVAFPKFRWQARPQTFAYAIAHYAAMRLIKAEKRFRHLGEEALADLPLPTQSRTASYLKTDMKHRIAQLRERLSADDQDFLMLKYGRGFTFQEIAVVFLENGLEATDQQLLRETNRLVRRYLRLKQRLKRMAEDDGLLPPSAPEAPVEPVAAESSTTLGSSDGH